VDIELWSWTGPQRVRVQPSCLPHGAVTMTALTMAKGNAGGSVLRRRATWGWVSPAGHMIGPGWLLGEPLSKALKGVTEEGLWYNHMKESAFDPKPTPQ
jgi:hypothetical protein